MSRKDKKLPTILGPLEWAVLDFFWENGEASVIDVHRSVAEASGNSVNTIGSTLERLYRKGLLVRHKVSHAFQYQPNCTKEEFLTKQVLENAGGLQELSGKGLLISFLDLVEDTDDETLNELEKLIAEKRSRGN